MYNKKHELLKIYSLLLRFRAYLNDLSHQQKTLLIPGILILSLLLIGSITLKAHKKTVHTSPLLIRTDKNILIPEGSPLRTHLLVQPVTVTNKPHHIVFPGLVETDQSKTISIVPPTTGRLIHLHTQLGNQVKKGQLLATMQSPDLAQAYADAVKAKSALKQSIDALERAQKVHRAGANSLKDLDQLQDNYNQAKAELQRAQQTYKMIASNHKQQVQIKAPVDGKIIALNYGIGSYLNDPTQVLFTLSNIDTVWVSACIPEHLVSLVKKGQKVTINLPAYPDAFWSARITFIDNIIDPDTRCNKSRIVFDNKERKFQPNMFASINAQLPQKKHIMVPLSAVVMDNDNTSVFVETAPWIFTQRDVTLGTEDAEQVRITAGLNVNDRIVMAGGVLIND